MSRSTETETGNTETGNNLSKRGAGADLQNKQHEKEVKTELFKVFQPQQSVETQKVEHIIIIQISGMSLIWGF